MFEVGQTVRIREWDDMVAEFGGDYDSIPCRFGFVKEMEYLCGRIFVIRSIRNDRVYPRSNSKLFLGQTFAISTDMIESADESKLAISINPESLQVLF